MKKLALTIILLIPFVYANAYAHCKPHHPHHCAKKAAKKVSKTTTKAGKKVGRTAKKAGKKVGRTAKKAGKKVGRTAQKAADKAWKHTKKELTRTLKTCKLKPGCLAKIKLYQSYMIQLRTGVKMHRLHPKYLKYASLYGGLANLNNYRFGYSNRQPKRNATTDCNKTYYNDKNYVRQLRQGTVPPNRIKWLLHELEHYNQCRRVEGRDRYILMWFKHLKPNTSIKKIHDSMRMEKDAERMAKSYCRRLAPSCRF